MEFVPAPWSITLSGWYITNDEECWVTIQVKTAKVLGRHISVYTKLHRLVIQRSSVKYYSIYVRADSLTLNTPYPAIHTDQAETVNQDDGAKCSFGLFLLNFYLFFLSWLTGLAFLNRCVDLPCSQLYPKLYRLSPRNTTELDIRWLDHHRKLKTSSP